MYQFFPIATVNQNENILHYYLFQINQIEVAYQWTEIFSTLILSKIIPILKWHNENFKKKQFSNNKPKWAIYLIFFRDKNLTINNYPTYQTGFSTAYLNELAYFVVMTRPMIVVIDHFPFLLGEEKGKCIF